MDLVKRRNRIRRKVKKLNEAMSPRLTIFRSELNIYCQLIDSKNGHILASCSTLEKDFKQSNVKSYNMEGARLIGQTMGKKIKLQGISIIVYDRSGYKYHGRVKSLIDAIAEEIKG